MLLFLLVSVFMEEMLHLVAECLAIGIFAMSAVLLDMFIPCSTTLEVC